MRDEPNIVAELHDRDPIAAWLGIELVSAQADRVQLRMAVGEAHVGGHGLCHGGVLFTLADVVMSYVANRHGEGALASHGSVELLAPVHPGDVVEAVGRESAARGRGAVCDVELSVAGATVALFRGTTRRRSS